MMIIYDLLSDGITYVTLLSRSNHVFFCHVFIPHFIHSPRPSLSPGPELLVFDTVTLRAYSCYLTLLHHHSSSFTLPRPGVACIRYSNSSRLFVCYLTLLHHDGKLICICKYFTYFILKFCSDMFLSAWPLVALIHATWTYLLLVALCYLNLPI